jgi:hypothetical protein
VRDEEEKNMAVLESRLNIDAFKEMKRILQKELLTQNITPEEAKKEILNEWKKK